MIRLTLSFLLLAVISVGTFAADSESVDLRYRSYRNWTVQLPTEQWFPVNDGIQIGEYGDDFFFAVAMDGNQLKFDTDGDSKLDRTIKPLVDPKTNVSTTRVILSGKKNSGEVFKYAARLRRDAKGWEWAPGGAMAGTVNSPAGPVPIRIIDQNGNGKFDDWGSDAMIVGNSDFATLLSKTIYVGGELRSVSFGKSKNSIVLAKYDGPTATIDMKSNFESKAVLLSSIIASNDNQHSFDVGAIEGSVKVPAGKYRIVSGTVGLGQQRATIDAGKMKSIDLPADKQRELNWGGPIRSEFRFARAGGQIEFSPDQIWFYGKAGEQYAGWTPVGKSPEFKILNADTGAVIEVAILPGSC